MDQNKLLNRILPTFLFIILVSIVLFLLPRIEATTLEYIGGMYARSVTSEMFFVSLQSFASYLFPTLKILFWMSLVVAIVRLLTAIILATVLRSVAHSEIVSLTRTVVSVLVYITAFFVIFQSHFPDVQLAALFTGSTIVGIVVGLALQDTLGNFFSGVALQADHPFQVGDVISVASRAKGVVESVTWRGVKIRTFQDKLIIISNSVIGKEVIEVAPKDNLNARLVFFNTEYGFSPSRTAKLVREAVRNISNVSPLKRPIVRIRDLAESGIDWEIKYWCEDYRRHNDTDAVIRQTVWYLFTRESIRFAFPTRTVHVEGAASPIAHEERSARSSEAIASVPIFAPLSENDLDELATHAVARVFAPGEVIVEQGKSGGSMFIITQGGVRIEHVEGGDRHVLTRLGTGDFFGEMSLLTGEKRSASVIADDETQVIEIRKKELAPILKKDPSLAERIAEIVELRRNELSAIEDRHHEDKTPNKQGILLSVKQFFGLRK
ncbi:MAG: mechanosensitive ion channel family protein [Acidobacteria bacterium]|nr:mechanosensitive ion channel family protein [Acidobacteriota bacterium]